MPISTIDSKGLNQAGDTTLCTTSGNVGIGTASPSFKLQTVGGAIAASRARSNTAGDMALMVAPSDSSIQYGFRIDSNTNSLNLDYGVTGSYSNRVTLDASGNLKLTNLNNIASITQTAISLTGGTAGSPFVNGQSVNVITANSTTRGILIVGSTQNCSAIFFINASAAVNLSSQTTNETRFSITSGSSNTVNVFVSGSNIVLQNNIQASRDFYVTYIGQI
jgi:hypothetical protein